MKLCADDGNVVHWAYPMAGWLTMCGSRSRPAGGPTAWRTPTEVWPTCIQCVAIKWIYDENFPNGW